ncbi:MAG: rRNA maturation RNase YbeY, partial [Ginsengibacter sp.]
MSAIKIFYESNFKSELELSLVKRLIIEIFKTEGIPFDFLNIIFCSDEYLLRLNKKFLTHNTYTDIITFNYSNNNVEGELYISWERALVNANKFKVNMNFEILRLIIHGCLHL